MKCSRRAFLLSGVSGALALGHGSQLVFGAESNSPSDILVVVFLRGGYDALNVIGPVDDSSYKGARGTDTRIVETGSNAGLSLGNANKGFDFRLHPKAAPLKELYDHGELAFIHACGVPNGTRSHFDAQSLIERGISEEGSARIGGGWLTRHLISAGLQGMIPAVSTSGTTPESLSEFANACCINDIGAFSFQGHWKYGSQQQEILKNAYAGSDLLSVAGARALQTLNIVSSRVKKDKDGNVVPYQPQHGAKYPSDDNGQGLTTSLELLARLVRMKVGLRVGLVDFDGWDTHQSQAYIFPNLLDALSRALHAFYTDLEEYRKNVTVVVLSEFGRRLRQNESSGTDHGHGSLIMVLGGNVNGGKMYGAWPGLATQDLDQGVDLRVTTDYRSVLSEVVNKRLGNPRVDLVFPRFSPVDLGILKGDRC